MIPINETDPPHNFNNNVENPGQNFLTNYPNPTKENWKKKGNKIYQRASDHLYKSYKKVCAYSALYIPYSEKTVDHFIPKSQNATLAFKWSNFRLSFEILNQNKSSDRILDPFTIQPDWFVIDFDLNLVKSNKKLDSAIRHIIDYTIIKLDLNGKIISDKRIDYIHAYYEGTPATIDGLKKKAPFIAYELERQNLVEEIKVKYERYLRETGKL